MEFNKLLGINTPSTSTVKVTVNWIDGISDNNLNQIVTTVDAYSHVKEMFPRRFETVFNDVREGTIGNTEARIDPGFFAQWEGPIDQVAGCLQRIKEERVFPEAIVGVDIPEARIDGVGEVLGQTLVESYLLDSGLPEFKSLELTSNSGDSPITPPNLTSQLRAATTPELKIYIFNKFRHLPAGQEEEKQAA